MVMPSFPSTFSSSKLGKDDARHPSNERKDPHRDEKKEEWRPTSGSTVPIGFDDIDEHDNPYDHSSTVDLIAANIANSTTNTPHRRHASSPPQEKKNPKVNTPIVPTRKHSSLHPSPKSIVSKRLQYKLQPSKYQHFNHQRPIIRLYLIMAVIVAVGTYYQLASTVLVSEEYHENHLTDELLLQQVDATPPYSSMNFLRTTPIQTGWDKEGHSVPIGFNAKTTENVMEKSNDILSDTVSKVNPSLTTTEKTFLPRIFVLTADEKENSMYMHGYEHNAILSASERVSLPHEPLEKDEEEEDDPPLSVYRGILPSINSTSNHESTTSSVNGTTRFIGVGIDSHNVPGNATSEDPQVSDEDKGDLGKPSETEPSDGNDHANIVGGYDDGDIGNEVEQCVAAEDWQTEAHPNCNSVHEMDIGIESMAASKDDINWLGQGWFRMTWKYKGVVLKMLRLEREYLDEYYELHRRDAVAMDHLTFSPYVMHVYGYCGQSAVNEIAEFQDGINALEQLDRRMRGQHGESVLILKLRLAISVSAGMYHVHYGKPGMPWDDENINTNFINRTKTQLLPTMAHYDINPRNIAITAGGKPKLNDFNIAEFLRYPKTNRSIGGTSFDTDRTCGFPSRLHEPWWRAPEEMNVTASPEVMVNEKVDIYALGAVLYHILTTHSPRGKMKKERMDEVRKDVAQGVHPVLMEPWASDKNPIVLAFREAMELCFHKDPERRGTAGEVATVLFHALEQALDLEAKQPSGEKHSTHKKSHRHQEGKDHKGTKTKKHK